MDMLKIGVLGIAGVFLSLFVREWKPQFSALISNATCTLIFFCAISRIQALAGVIAQLVQYLTVKEAYLKILLKIVGIAYIADFAASICRDAGYSAVAGQIELTGKISVLTVSTPIVLALLNTISEYLQ